MTKRGTCRKRGKPKQVKGLWGARIMTKRGNHSKREKPHS